MKEWFDGLDPKERRTVIIGAAVLLVMSLYFLGWEPFINKLHDLQQSTQRKQADLAWMQQAAKEVKILNASSARSAKPDSGQSLLGVIDTTAKSRRLSGAVKRVQPEGDAKARVWLENAQFDIVVRWLEELQIRRGVVVESSIIEKLNEAGLINARIVFQIEEDQ